MPAAKNGALRAFANPRMVPILLMGFASGLPLALTGGTLSLLLKDAGLSLTAIGFYAYVRLAYVLKFLWAPVLDRVPVPWLTARLGRRRSWAFVIQSALAVAVVALGASDPAQDPWRVGIIAVVVAILSASQDIVIDAFRIEYLTEPEQSEGAAATQIGYRFGMIASGAGALYLAQGFGWFYAYAAMAALVLVGMVTILATREPHEVPPPPDNWITTAVIDPFADFMRRRQWLAILVFVLLYKVGDAFAGNMSNTFYVTIGFAKGEIASITKVFGTGASIVGLMLGGILAYRLGVMRALLLCGALQMLSNLMYIVQLRAGHDPLALTATIAIENAAGAMSSAAFVAYLSGLCSPAFTATQYALLSALAAAAGIMLAAWGGVVIDAIGWAPFFLVATLACLPGLALLLWLMRQPTDPRESPA